ncbi:MAG TPA: methylmalonyl-CoA epimerase [Anaeromyxobacteraceae bacterium]|nr:methylmalonyl-CoA epimerase [Anaeromyxobacteraceae bacterium]
MKGLDHVAILVSDLEAAIALYRDVYGLELAEVEEVPTEKVRVAIFGHGAGRIELVSPSSPDSPMAKAIEKRGEGLHHVCLEVPDIEAAMAALRARGAPLLDDKPRPGAGGARVAFVHPKGSRGVLVELRQGPKSP